MWTRGIVRRPPLANNVTESHRRTGFLPIVACVLAAWALLTSCSSNQAEVAPSPTPAAGSRTTQPPDDLRLSMSPALLTALVRDWIAQGRSSIQLQNAVVTTGPGTLTISGDLPTLNRTTPVSMTFQPYVSDGALATHVVQAKFGPIPIPGNLTSLAEGPINARLAAATSGAPVSVTDVRTEASGLTIGARLDSQHPLP
jgi:hypothetical protein